MKKIIVLISVVSVLSMSILYFSGVYVTASLKRDGDENRCPLSSPIFVNIKNYTFSTVRDVTFNLELFKDNRSRNLLTDTSNGYRVFNVVIPPFSEESGCFTDAYIKSFVEPNPIDIAKASRKEAIRSSLESVKNFVEFENTHTIYVSNVNTSYLD